MRKIAFSLFGLFLLIFLPGCETGPGGEPGSGRGGAAANAAFSDLVDLVEERLALMYPVAKYKWRNNMPAEDFEREEDLLDLVIEEGGRRGLSASLVESFFVVQLEAGLQLQEHYLAGWSAESPENFENVPDLEGELRPELERIARAMVAQLARVYTSPPSEENAEERLTAARENLVDSGRIPEKAVDIALSPFAR